MYGDFSCILPSDFSGLAFGWIAFKLKAGEDAVATTLDKPEVEAELIVQAQAAGLSLAQFLRRKPEAITLAAPARR
jgi:hypothetical protein